MIVKRIKNKDTFKFFNYKWKRVPEWAEKTEKIYVAPGNAGTSEICENLEVDLNNFEEL